MDERFLKPGPSAALLACLMVGIGLFALAIGAGVTAVGFLAFAERPGADGDLAEAQPAELEGSWSITYTNKTVRHYVIDDEGNVTFVEGQLTGHAEKQADDTLLLIFDGDGKLERLTLGTDGRLFVEHYSPRANFPQQEPSEIGIGIRQN